MVVAWLFCGAGKAFEIDCADYGLWTAAATACAAVQRGHGGSEALMMLAGPKLKPENRFHFTQVQLPKLALNPTAVHGLLGQRALRLPSSGAGAQLAGAGEHGPAEVGTAAGYGSQGEGAIDGVYTDYVVGALGEHGTGRFAKFGPCRTQSQ